ncbi:hypothetical protein FRC98_15800 [Lujinxingia vulgaris]|uniref:Uncharacterized protein n=1 Tax=Lujinxingia vulgaris TaxID=2600176 RepID=A0A5C6XC33_9DELT|nr:hypothetical protein [Lujinxingia vulgaris]TXD35668.1 hypothetical protein FRC98_15800 [Lujinxingia vulgaris]
MLKRLLLSCLLVSGLSLTTIACSGDADEDNTIETDAGEDTGTDASEDAGDDADEDVDPGPQTGELADPDITAASCEEISAEGCFSNDDCGASEVCFDVSRGDDVACCVPGTRGTFEPGDACSPETGELECASGLCAQYDTEEGEVSACTTTCTGEVEGECPDAFPECVFGICSPPAAE